jgi:hypothetical protein
MFAIAATALWQDYNAILHAAKPGDQALQLGALHHYFNTSGCTRALVEQNRQSAFSAINSRAHLFTIGQQRRDFAHYESTNRFIKIHRAPILAS